jgi:hypothetical protein
MAVKVRRLCDGEFIDLSPDHRCAGIPDGLGGEVGIDLSDMEPLQGEPHRLLFASCGANVYQEASVRPAFLLAEAEPGERLLIESDRLAGPGPHEGKVLWWPCEVLDGEC